MKRYNSNHTQYLKTLPRKRTASSVLFLNDRKEILIVKAFYKTGWSLPGGVIDKNESPKQAAIRETKEEVGITVKNPKLTCIYWGWDEKAEEDFLVFVFFGGIVKKSDVQIDNQEIVDSRFVNVKEMKKLVSPGTAKRTLESLKNLDFNNIYIEE